ncbi:hypothetical protein [Pseudorhodoferax sp. Leaf267]|uniref:hypothetical protein n=1 Tax=Pseudorhodoferax sp. Leaf267 TaxID=1736316 RepID=UPI0012E291E8|nr:hypothetical protein [Pseudorhodoferax sp. Leaf267]
MRRLSASLVLLVAVSAATFAVAQTSPARGPISPTASVPDDQPLADYLALLQQIAPAAADAARTYVAAVRLRCGHALDSAALRQAMARDGGDPVLMGLIRASAAQDTGARHRLVDQMRCEMRGTP